MLRAYYHGSNAVIEVRDDGRGIDADRVLAKAVESGLVDAERAGSMTRSEIYQLIFAPRLSTAATVSTLSGRGVGMDVVMTAIGQVQGSILVDSNPGQGTTIRMRLPLTLAVVGVLLVRERDHMFAVPIQHVDEILTVSLGELRQMGNSTLYGHRGSTIAVITLSSLLDFPSSAFAGRDTSMIILVEGERRVGLLVDAVIGRQEVLIKSLARLLKKAPHPLPVADPIQIRMGLNSGDVILCDLGRRRPHGPDDHRRYRGPGGPAGVRQQAVWAGAAGRRGDRSPMQEKFAGRLIDLVKVKGKNQPIACYEILAERGQTTAKQDQLIAMFDEATSAFQAGQSERALELFREADGLEAVTGSDQLNPCGLYQDRCQ